MKVLFGLKLIVIQKMRKSRSAIIATYAFLAGDNFLFAFSSHSFLNLLRWMRSSLCFKQAT